MDSAIPPPEQSTPSTQPITSPAPDDEVDWTGQVLGEFRILHRLGRGGMGQVYLAEQTSLKRKVALKLLNPELASNQRSLLRFKAEAENVARATHANIVQIYMIGQANGVNYIALEYVEGKNLGEFIQKKGTPELALGLHIMTQVAAALQRASEIGLIHRDIKPENIMLTKKGEVKVADFGLSREFAEGGSQPSLTLSQVTMGTPLYMSPEQVERRPVDPRTDIYSFGVTCYHMFAGTPPFRGASPVDVAYKHVHEEPPPLAAIRPDLPTELCIIIHKMMAKKPEDRFQTAREIVRDINRLCEALNLGAGAVSISASFLGTASGALRHSATQVLPETKSASFPWLRVLLVAGVFAALLGGLFAGWYHNHRDQQAKGPPNEHLPPLPIDFQIQNGRKPKTDEKELQQLVDKYAYPEGQTQLGAGLEHSLDLGEFYIREKRFDEAEKFFESLNKPERKFAYRLLGRIGHAIVLSFKDEEEASNKEFADIEKKEFERLENFTKKTKKDSKFSEEIEDYRSVWKQNLRLREMVAQALNRNYINDPVAFGKDGHYKHLNDYRIPPRPVLRPPPKDSVPMPISQ